MVKRTEDRNQNLITTTTAKTTTTQMLTLRMIMCNVQWDAGDQQRAHLLPEVFRPKQVFPTSLPSITNGDTIVFQKYLVCTPNNTHPE